MNPDHNDQIKELRRQLAEKEAECTSLRAEHSTRNRFLQRAPIIVFCTNRNGRIIWLNRAGCEILGYDEPDEALGTHVDDYFCDPGALRGLIRAVRNQEFIKDFEARMRTRQGREIYVLVNAMRRQDENCSWQGFDGFAQEISKRKDAENALKTSEEKYRTVLENSLAAIYLFRDGGIFSYANQRMVELLGYDSEDEIIGKPFWSIVAPEDRELVRERGLQRERGEVYPRRYVFRMIKKDGTRLWVDMQSSHASYLGRPAVVGNWIDITKRVQAQEEVRRLSRRLIQGIEEERRSLAADLHDEFGQHLSLLRFDMERLQAGMGDAPEPIRRACDQAIGQIGSLAAKIRATTSRLRPDILDHLGLTHAMQWYVDGFRKHTPVPKIELKVMGLKKRLAPEVELTLYRVFQESLSNILKHADAQNITVKLTASHPKVIMAIQDDGVGFEQNAEGMPVEALSQGIGLLAMQERVASLGGRLRIISGPGKGVCIRAELMARKDESCQA